MDKPKVFVRLIDLNQLTNIVLGQIQRSGENFTHIVGVSRGGLVPAVKMSHRLGAPLVLTNYSSSKGNGDDKLTGTFKILEPDGAPINASSKVLIVDDICDSGHTLEELVWHLQELTPHVHTACLHHRLTAIMTPDFIGRVLSEDDGWVIYPWENQC